jgi:ATP-binding cassette subfamily B protein
VLQLVAEGHATPGDLALAVTLASQVDSTVAGAVQIFGSLQQTLRTTGYYLWLVDYANTAGPAAGSGDGLPAQPRELLLDRVSFTYPGTAAPVLRDVSLQLQAGSTVALVGENGAGKTTLVKLLCRLYEPTAGRILLDGKELRDVPAAAWRSRLAAGFQDFVRFELLASESIGVGDLQRIDRPAAVLAALDRAGSRDLPASLPAGIDTQLGRSFQDGVDVSSGQWQKIAMARAMMRDRPDLLLLDEPTASLDAQTEHTLFARWAGRGDHRGTITVLVSHRFSTVRMADLIVVLDRGSVREVGTHEQLMTSDGLYASLYRLHARAYGDEPLALGARRLSNRIDLIRRNGPGPAP